MSSNEILRLGSCVTCQEKPKAKFSPCLNNNVDLNLTQTFNRLRKVRKVGGMQRIRKLTDHFWDALSLSTYNCFASCHCNSALRFRELYITETKVCYSAGGLGLYKNYKEQIWIIFLKTAKRALEPLSNFMTVHWIQFILQGSFKNLSKINFLHELDLVKK